MVYLKMLAVFISNILVFLSVVISRGISPLKWPEAWRKMKASHERDIDQMLLTLRLSGDVEMRVVDGEELYFPSDSGS